MKKWFIVLLVLGIIFSFSYAFLSNGFSDIEKIVVEKYDRDGKEIGKEKTIEDKSTINTFTQILNKASHEGNREYEMAYHPDYRITILYEDKSKEELSVWKEPGPYMQFFSKAAWFKIKNEERREEFIKILN